MWLCKTLDCIMRTYKRHVFMLVAQIGQLSIVLNRFWHTHHITAIMWCKMVDIMGGYVKDEWKEMSEN